MAGLCQVLVAPVAVPVAEEPFLVGHNLVNPVIQADRGIFL